MNANELRFWRRFIDDGLGIWRGSRRSFEAFVKKLNRETNKYGINFPINELQFGKSVNFLDITLYIDENNHIQYKSYTKPTDAKRYLRPQSFHPRSVFKSVPLSQIIRTIERNSKEETEKEEMEKMFKDFEQSGYEMNTLKEVERKARELLSTERNTKESNALTFPLFFFNDISEYKIIYDHMENLRQIIGDTKIIMAVKKNPSIGNTVVMNKFLSSDEQILDNQKCGATNCMQCPLVNISNTVNVN